MSQELASCIQNVGSGFFKVITKSLLCLLLRAAALLIISRNVWLVVAQSTISTFQGRSDSENASWMAALVASWSGDADERTK